MSECCTPGRGAVGTVDPTDIAVQHVEPPPTSDEAAGRLIDVGTQMFTMGSVGPLAIPGDGEGPAHVVRLASYSIAPHTVTNAEFADFVAATNYRTDAERFRWSFVFGPFLPDDFPDTRGVADAPWWRQVFGADWRHPDGPESTLEGRSDHPVVHVSWRDAVAYCDWRNVRLPTEAEWECAARGGLSGCDFPWGDELEPDGRHAMNVFQGTFPAMNSAADGYAGTAPVDAYPPNELGLHQMTGNVWEWCADWYSPTYYASSAEVDPPGPATGIARVMRGGSYLCHESYCRRYRVSARSSNTPDSSAGNVGFRVASSAITG
ncbi:MAG TPA: formylglycine-generating enzyme family protein [Ilumatobacteraceae bacterium]